MQKSKEGYGREAIRLVKKLCFEELSLHRLWLDVFTTNVNAIRLYESEGFQYEGELRECVGPAMDTSRSGFMRFSKMNMSVKGNQNEFAEDANWR